MKIAFWGTGNTALNSLEQIQNISEQFEMIVFTDGSLEKVESNSLWKGFRLILPQNIQRMNIDYLCILSIWEWDIRRRIYEENWFPLSKIINLHEVNMLSIFGTDLNNSYKKMLYTVRPAQRFYFQEWEIYESLKRKYAYVLCDRKYWKFNIDKKVDLEEDIRPIWLLWLQGMEAAPKIVKMCIHSIEKASGKRDQIFLLDQNNIFDYIDLPEYIVKKWKDGIISHTHFSDIVRVRLLNIYGGIWIDSTVYFTGRRLPDYIKKGSLFMLSRWLDWKSCPEPKIMASWLISSQPENKMLMILEGLLNEYWKKEEKLADYFLMHIFFSIIAFFLPDEWEKVEKVFRDPAQLLMGELDCAYDKSRFEYIKEVTDFHKLSYYGIPYEKCDRDSLLEKIYEMEGMNDNE
ncbi:capsular polysaccharide synthesis protein [Lachnospiraceae bacterium 48-21]